LVDKLAERSAVKLVDEKVEWMVEVLVECLVEQRVDRSAAVLADLKAGELAVCLVGRLVDGSGEVSAGQMGGCWVEW